MRKRIIPFRSGITVALLALGGLAVAGCNSLTEPHDLRVVKEDTAKQGPQTNGQGATGDQGAAKRPATDRGATEKAAADRPATDATKRGEKIDRIKRPANLPAVNNAPSGGSCGD